MVIQSSKALLMIYTSVKLASLLRIKSPTALRVSVKGPNITIECELTMRLRLLYTAVRQTPRLFLTFPPRHQDLRLPPSHRAQSALPGLTILTMKRVSRFNESKVLQAYIRPLRRRQPRPQVKQ